METTAESYGCFAAVCGEEVGHNTTAVLLLLSPVSPVSTTAVRRPLSLPGVFHARRVSPTEYGARAMTCAVKWDVDEGKLDQTPAATGVVRVVAASLTQLHGRRS